MLCVYILRWLQYILYCMRKEYSLIFLLRHDSCKNKLKLYLHAVSSSFQLQHQWFLTAHPDWFLLSENLVMILQSYQTDTPFRTNENWIMKIMVHLLKSRLSICLLNSCINMLKVQSISQTEPYVSLLSPCPRNLCRALIPHNEFMPNIWAKEYMYRH